MGTDYTPLDPQELQAILSRIAHPVVLACIAFYYESDLSLMDCLALQWADINFETSTVRLRSGTMYPLSNREYAMLRRWGILLGLGRRIQSGDPGPGSTIFVFPVGKSPSEGAAVVESSFAQAVANLGKEFTFRDLSLAVLRRNMSTIDIMRNRTLHGSR